MSPRSSSDQRRALRCHLACWQEAYSGLVDADRLAEITGDLERAIGWWQKAPTSDRTMILAMDGDLVAGFATAGPTTEPGVDIALQLNAINVRRAYWGTGVGATAA